MPEKILHLHNIKPIRVKFNYTKPEPDSGYPGGYEIEDVWIGSIPIHFFNLSKTYQSLILNALEEQRG